MTSSSKVFVGNLNFATTKDELATAFSEAGEVVDVHIPADRETGRPRGFAFVQFSTPEAAAEAISKFDGRELAGRPLRVSEAQERRGGGRGDGNGFRRAPSPERTYRSRSAGGGGPPSDFDPGWDRGNRFDGDEGGGWSGGGGGGGGGDKGRRNRPKGSRRGLRAKKRSL